MNQKQRQKNREATRKMKERIAQQLKKGAGKGVEAAVRFLAARIKETVSVPAPKKAVRSTPAPGKKLGGVIAYRATAPATEGAPPRLLSGKLRQGVTHKMESPIKGLVGVHARSMPSKKHPAGFDYPKHLEAGPEGELGDGDHPFILPTAKKYRRELRTIVGTEARVGMKGRS